MAPSSTPMITKSSFFPVRRHLLGAFQAFRSQFEYPRENERDRKTECDQQNNQPHDPIRNCEKGEYLGRDLDEEPRDNRIGDGHSIDVAPLELGEEVLRVHFTPAIPHSAFVR